MLGAVLAIIVSVACINSVVVAADDQCIHYEFDPPFFTGVSCEDLYNKNPQTHDKSGYYWITNGLRNVYCGMSYAGESCEDIYNNNPETRDKNGYYRMNNKQWTYCNMTAIASNYFTFSCAGVLGHWRRIASFDISAGDNCPAGWKKASHSDISFCRSLNDNSGCYLTSFSSEISYNRVCGRVKGYEKGSPDGFKNGDIDDYVDGLSITHGNPRQHIWTYAIGHTESGSIRCPCTATPGTSPPSFVGSNYYCESGADADNDENMYYLSDPLWDGKGCSSGNNCCSNSNLPWFQYELSEATQDDVDVRICRDEQFSNEGILIDILELYVQ